MPNATKQQIVERSKKTKKLWDNIESGLEGISEPKLTHLRRLHKETNKVLGRNKKPLKSR